MGPKEKTYAPQPLPLISGAIIKAIILHSNFNTKK
jgi:hypothetical protein